jgi:L-threonylcarbamoyladenylate synthase
VTEVVSIERDGAAAARAALEWVVDTGGLAVFPADGVYGLACDPGRAEAVERINALKGRDPAKPSAVMFFAPLAMRELVATLGPRTREAFAALLPGPVTLVVRNPERLYPLACAADPERLGVRLIGGPLSGAATAILQTSANPSGAPARARFDALDPEVVAGADLAIDGGELGGSPSTVIDLTAIDADGRWEVVREGGLSSSEVARLLERR